MSTTTVCKDLSFTDSRIDGRMAVFNVTVRENGALVAQVIDDRDAGLLLAPVGEFALRLEWLAEIENFARFIRAPHAEKPSDLTAETIRARLAALPDGDPLKLTHETRAAVAAVNYGSWQNEELQRVVDFLDAILPPPELPPPASLGPTIGGG